MKQRRIRRISLQRAVDRFRYTLCELCSDTRIDEAASLSAGNKRNKNRGSMSSFSGTPQRPPQHSPWAKIPLTAVANVCPTLALRKLVSGMNQEKHPHCTVVQIADSNDELCAECGAKRLATPVQLVVNVRRGS